MAISKTLLLAFIFSVTLLVVSDVLACQLATKPLSTQQTQSVKLKEDSNGGSTPYETQPKPYDGVDNRGGVTRPGGPSVENSLPVRPPTGQGGGPSVGNSLPVRPPTGPGGGR